MSALADFESTFEKSFSRARERTCTIGEFATQTRDKKRRRYFSRCFLSYLPRFSLQVLPQDVVLYALFDRVLESVFSVELRVSPYSFDEQRVFFQRLACMQNFTALIIIDIYHADNEFERRSPRHVIFSYMSGHEIFSRTVRSGRSCLCENTLRITIYTLKAVLRHCLAGVRLFLQHTGFNPFKSEMLRRQGTSG